ncbi:MAG: helix-turn-helix domain-containing protein [Stellaceae bacterium]
MDIGIGRRDAHARIAHLFCEIFERLRLVGETVDHRYMLPVTQVELADAQGMSEVHANRMLRRLRPAAHGGGPRCRGRPHRA